MIVTTGDEAQNDRRHAAEDNLISRRRLSPRDTLTRYLMLYSMGLVEKQLDFTLLAVAGTKTSELTIKPPQLAAPQAMASSMAVTTTT